MGLRTHGVRYSFRKVDYAIARYRGANTWDVYFLHVLSFVEDL